MATKAKVPTKKEQDSEMLERTMNAFYMLAGVVDKNTKCMEALLLSLHEVAPPTAAPAPAPEPDFQEKAVEKVYTKEECQAIIVDICGVEGKDIAMELLQKFEASKLGEINPDHYESFVLNGQRIVDARGE
tara:strand:- start:546 stop:938 length:393 start_codon:yes stop_codon:yes gene_type:complete